MLEANFVFTEHYSSLADNPPQVIILQTCPRLRLTAFLALLFPLHSPTCSFAPDSLSTYKEAAEETELCHPHWRMSGQDTLFFLVLLPCNLSFRAHLLR